MVSGYNKREDFFEALSAAGCWAHSMGMTEFAHVKLAHEAHEFADEPSMEELADVMICIAGAMVQRDWKWDDLTKAIDAKMKVNYARTWTRLADGTWRHE